MSVEVSYLDRSITVLDNSNQAMDEVVQAHLLAAGWSITPLHCGGYVLDASNYPATKLDDFAELLRRSYSDGVGDA